ncbi:hypothetical protein ACNU7U_004766, partial [Escherichia coli]
REEIPAHDDGMRPDAIFAVNRYIINGARLGVVVGGDDVRQNLYTQSFALDCKTLCYSIVVKVAHSTFPSSQSAHHCIISLRLT